MITQPKLIKHSTRLLVTGVSIISAFLSTIPATAEDDPPAPFLLFNGADSRIVTPANATALGINARNSKTMEAWVKIHAFNDAAVLDIGPRGSNGQNFGLTARDNGRWRVHCWGNDLDFPEPASAATLHQWAHLAITYDGTRLRGFINGEQVAERTQHTSRILNTSDAQNFQIGVDSRLAPYFKGEMRDVRVWSANRNASQIQSTMNTPPLDGEGNPLPNLRAWWPMDEGSGSMIHDRSGNGHHATNIGAQWPSLQYEYEEVEADFTKDFGSGAGKVNQLSLLRNREDHWTLQEDALRMSPVTDQSVSTGALAPVTNREPGREFTLETEVRLHSFMDARASRAGLIALAGPHTPMDAPFDVGADQGFYAFTFYPAAPQATVNARFPSISPATDGTAVIEISRGFNGPVLAAAAWEGRKPLPFPTMFEDNFEDLNTVVEDFTEELYTDEDWVARGPQATWEIGFPTVGPTTDGSRVAATKLNSIVPTFSDDSLFSPVIDLTSVTAAVLTFRETHNFESDIASDGTPDARASIRVVNEDLELIVELDSRFGNTSNSNGWRLTGFVLPPEVLGQRVRVEFHMKTNHNVWPTHYGWMIDDFSIQIPESQLDGYALKAEGSYNFLGELDLSFTVTDLKEGSNHSQTISATDIRPLSGNLFGIGGRIQASPLGGPEFDFKNLSMTLGDEVEIVPSVTETARFTYLFGSPPLRVEPNQFALNKETDWELQETSLRLATNGDPGNSMATTRIVEFKSGSPIQIESDIVMTSYNASVGGKVGLVLFGAEELTVLNPADSSTYYTFQYDVGSARILFREGMDGTILYEAPFTAGPTVGATYSMAFSGRTNQAGVFEFTASIDDHNGGKASLSGTLVGSLENRSRFGIAAAQGGGDVWDFLSFSGNTTDGNARYLVFNGVSDVIETGLKASALGVSGNAAKTIEAWVYTQTFNGGGPLTLGRTGTNNQDFSLRTLATPNLWRAQFWGGADFDFTPSVQTQNAWTHLAMAYDGELVRIFVNGELTSIVERNLNTQDHEVGMRIGRWGGDFFHGAIRDVRLWNVSRTEAQVSESMHTSPLGQSGLLGWWPLDEGVKDIAHDRSGNNRHGLIARPQWASVTRSINIGDSDDVTNHLDFTGLPGQVVRTTATASDLGVEGDKPKTLEAWAKVNIRGGGIVQLGERGTTGRDFSLRNRPNDGRYMAQFWGAPDIIFDAPFNSWTHFAITYTGTDVRVYVNGQLVAGNDGVELNTGGAPLEIGEWNTGPLINGSIRDVRVWNVARSGEEIQEYMNASPAGQTGLVGWWPLGEGLGNTARDESGNGRHGTILTPKWGGTFDLGNRSAKVVRNGTPVFLQWNSTYASSTAISEIGQVESTGFAGLVAPANTATIHTFSAPDHYGAGSMPMVWVRSVPVNGYESLRYVKFEIPDGDALRNPQEDAIHLSQFLFYRNGSRVDAVTITNPGGDNPSGGEASNLLGINPDTKWVDLNKAYLNDSHLVFDFGAVIEIDSYQIGTANDAAGRDPHRWRLYGKSSLEEDWKLIEDMDLNFALPGERQALTAVIPLAGAGFTFSDWLDSFFTDPADRNNPEVSGRLAAPAGDGVANILKYAFGLDPRIPVGSSELTQSELEGDKLRLTYLERIGATDIGYQPEKSFGLDGWDGEGIHEVLPRLPTADGEFEWVTVEIDINGEAKAFLRVKVLDLE